MRSARTVFAAGTFWLLGLSAGFTDDLGAPLLQEAVSAYRAGRPFEALEKLGALVESEPDNAVAKNYIWTITRKIRAEDAALGLSAGEREKAARMAEEYLADRRRRTNEILDDMRATARRSADLRSPADILDGMSGVHQFLGQELQGDLAKAQSKAYIDSIIGNLTRALEKNVFVSRKDQLRAQGYQAYLRGDLGETTRLWDLSLREDPGDRALAKELEEIKTVSARRAREERINELSFQAKAHFRAGDYEETLAAWKEVLTLDPRRPGVVEQAAVARAALEKSRLKKELKDRTNEGVVLYKNGDVFGAAQKWLKVLMDDPSHEEARGWLEHIGRTIGSVPSGKPAPLPSPSSGSVQSDKAIEAYKRGILFYAQSDLESAVAAWKEALGYDPGLVRAREALRQAQMEMSLR